ncbi:oxidoreductase [Tomitella fengzijianii]|uniref:Oxidoreductase n=1 Tax=Tomitella fengzijianii TaxID=2597660 RepID=A0A516X4B2_9ACTN|nr:oxidoreductase [Tomitella fengzijianii]QDQ97912.1 oxidoreductase [Tomitella fengzijianii]
MGLLDGLFGGPAAKDKRTRAGADRAYLVAWATSHDGVEGFVEPENSFNAVTIVLVDKDGNWTRRAPGGARGASRVGREAAIPIYDVTKVGYPQRMRDHIERARVRRRRELRAELLEDRAQQRDPVD